jgi:hypothetical protein
VKSSFTNDVQFDPTSPLLVGDAAIKVGDAAIKAIEATTLERT